MLTTFLTHAKTIVLAGSVACGDALGAHSYYTRHHDQHPENHPVAAGRIDHPDHHDRSDSRWQNHSDGRYFNPYAHRH